VKTPENLILPTITFSTHFLKKMWYIAVKNPISFSSSSTTVRYESASALTEPKEKSRVALIVHPPQKWGGATTRTKNSSPAFIHLKTASLGLTKFFIS
jgi:hypothetical protein